MMGAVWNDGLGRALAEEIAAAPEGKLREPRCACRRAAKPQRSGPARRVP